MRILMHTRPDWRELPGGDFVQLQRWSVWLREFGIQVRVSDSDQPDLHGVDLVHFNNLGRAYALWPALEHCRRRGVPTVLTTLYWPPDEYERAGRPGWAGLLGRVLPDDLRDRLKAAARWLRQPGQRAGLWQEIMQGRAGLNGRFLKGVDALIANSTAEALALQKLIDWPPVIHVVHSGVDAYYWTDDRALWQLESQMMAPGAPGFAVAGAEETTLPPERSTTAPGILCVARFDPQKGQHRLIEALRPLNLPLTLVGSDNPNYPRYREFCRKLAPATVTIQPRQSQARLRALYQDCRVHALCSWYETTGLTGLEAGSCGARVVMTSRGGTRDYGGDLAWYADPCDLSSIRDAVQQAWDSATTPDLHARVQQRFTWEMSTRALLDVYSEVLAAASSLRRAA
jgi:glycosyltransferase involved in cell wall biosynthesis